jgi:hypothetical protein
MEKICIKPVDDRIKVRVDALNILNQFKMRGFTEVSAFVGVIQDKLPKYKSYHELKHLLNFWASRRFNEDLNNELSQLLEDLKNE